MTTPRARAGQPYRAQPMDCSGSGCNGPKEGDCLGFCTLRRVHPSQVEQVNAMPIRFAALEPDDSIFDLEFPEVEKDPDHDFQGGMQMLAGMVLIFAVVCVFVTIYFSF